MLHTYRKELSSSLLRLTRQRLSPFSGGGDAAGVGGNWESFGVLQSLTRGESEEWGRGGLILGEKA